MWSERSGSCSSEPAMVRDLSLIVPCFNEAEHLRESVSVVRGVLDESGHDYELVFVDDGSRDETRAIIVELCAGQARDRFIFHERNRGRGAAVKTGFAASSGRVAGFLDIDLEVSASYLPSLVDAILVDGFDVVTGQRSYLFNEAAALHRHALSFAYRLLLKAALDCGLHDTETGCKFFRRESAAHAVLSSTADGWFWDTEVMTRAALTGLKIYEMPVLFKRRSDKRSTVRVLPDSVRYLIALERFRAHAGMSLRAKSPIYWTSRGYDLTMKLLYGGEYEETYAAVARQIPDGASVVDVCCGTARLGRDYFRDRSIDYLGLDFNGHFVRSARRHGLQARFFDALSEPIPPADYVIMCSSLYHFRACEDEVLDKMKAAARCAVILSEPVHNLTASRVPLVGRLARRLSKPGIGESRARYDLAALQALAKRHHAAVQYQPGQRNALVIMPARVAASNVFSLHWAAPIAVDR